MGYSSTAIASHGNATEYNSDFFLKEQIKYYGWILPGLLKIQADSVILPQGLLQILANQWLMQLTVPRGNYGFLLIDSECPRPSM